MPSKIDWTDAVGAASLSNGKAVPMDRFSSWTPGSEPIGPVEHAVGTGQRYVFPFRTDHTASFEIREIPNTSMALMLRLKEHLLRGGQCSVTTGDTLSSVYATCSLAPDTRPSIAMTDARELLYTFAVVLLNVAGSPVRMICVY
jgi:hypothetical protein